MRCSQVVTLSGLLRLSYSKLDSGPVSYAQYFTSHRITTFSASFAFLVPLGRLGAF